MKETKTTETNKNTNKKKMTFWDISKSVSLMALSLAIAGAVLGWQPFADPSRENISAYAVENNTSITNAESDEDYIVAPYTSIYDMHVISDAQFNRILKNLDPTTVKYVSQEMGENATPKEWLLRYAAHGKGSADELEEVLNATISVTLAADWRTSDSYVPTDESDYVGYTNNGHNYNGLNDEN